MRRAATTDRGVPAARVTARRNVAARHAAALALAALLAVGVAACGTSTVATGSYKGESQAVAQRIADFQTDVTGGEEQKLCGRDLARVALTRLHGECVQALKNQLGAILDYELTVKSIAVHGTNATARVSSTYSGKQRTTTIALVREGGAWRISAVQ
jgi:hypothetical protein